MMSDKFIPDANPNRDAQRRRACGRNKLKKFKLPGKNISRIFGGSLKNYQIYTPKCADIPQIGDRSMDTQTIEKGFERVWQMFQETDRKFQETDRKFQETDRKFERQIGELKELFKQTDKRIGDITGKWGRFVEGMVVPGMIAMFETRGIRIGRLFQRVKIRKDGAETEIDILGISDEYAVPVEVKSTLSPDDVKEYIEKLKDFRRFFPEYADRKIVGAVAGIVIEGGADRFAYRQGLFVIAQKGENVTILNDSRFIPKEF